MVSGAGAEGPRGGTVTRREPGEKVDNPVRTLYTRAAVVKMHCQ